MNFPKKTSLAIATFVLVAAGLEYGPGPSWLRLRKTRILEAFDFGPVSGAFPQGPAKASPTARTADRKGLAKTPVRQQDVRQIADPSGAMAHFYEALARTERREPGAITQVLHYGDSPVTADSITADARAILFRVHDRNVASIASQNLRHPIRDLRRLAVARRIQDENPLVVHVASSPFGYPTAARA